MALAAGYSWCPLRISKAMFPKKASMHSFAFDACVLTELFVAATIAAAKGQPDKWFKMVTKALKKKANGKL